MLSCTSPPCMLTYGAHNAACMRMRMHSNAHMHSCASVVCKARSTASGRGYPEGAPAARQAPHPLPTALTSTPGLDVKGSSPVCQAWMSKAAHQYARPGCQRQLTSIPGLDVKGSHLKRAFRSQRGWVCSALGFTFSRVANLAAMRSMLYMSSFGSWPS